MDKPAFAFRALVGAVAVPGALLAAGAPAASAAELAPYAHQLDDDVAATEAEAGAILDAAGLQAEEE